MPKIVVEPADPIDGAAGFSIFPAPHTFRESPSSPNSRATDTNGGLGLSGLRSR